MKQVNIRRFVTSPRWRALVVAIAVLMGSLAASAAWAQHRSMIELTTVAEMEFEVIDAFGAKQVVRKAAVKVVPGDEVIYTNHFTVVGEEAAEAVAITNPVPEHMVFTGLGDNTLSVLVTVSADGGKHYDRPDRLTLADAEGNPRPARPDEYTHVRWQFSEPVPPGIKGFVSFRARLK